MAILIGGGKNDILTGTDDPDLIFGDPFTTGAFDAPRQLGVLNTGKGGNDNCGGDPERHSHLMSSYHGCLAEGQ